MNRLPSDPDAPGGGFTIGAHIAKIVAGARRLGWYLQPTSDGFELRPGDGYHIDHVGRPNSDHVGVIVGVGEPRADGTRIVETADGGQNAGADVKRNQRVLSGDGGTLTLDAVPARLLGAIRAPEVAA